MGIFWFHGGNFFFQLMNIHVCCHTNQDFFFSGGKSQVIYFLVCQQINFVINDQIRDFLVDKSADQCIICVSFTCGAVYDQNSNVCFIQDLVALFYTKGTKFPFVINPWCVDDHYRSQWKKFHGFVNRVCGGSLYRGYDSKILSGDSVDHTGFSGVTSAEKADMYTF